MAPAKSPGKLVKVKARFNRAILDAAPGEMLRQLEYKSKWYGRTFVKVPKEFPSTRMCSSCGHVREPLDPKVRHWTCDKCGAEHDRDVNAAINIEAEGLRILGIEFPHCGDHPEVTGSVRAPGGEGASSPVAVSARITQAVETLSGTA